MNKQRVLWETLDQSKIIDLNDCFPNQGPSNVLVNSQSNEDLHKPSLGSKSSKKKLNPLNDEARNPSLYNIIHYLKRNTVILKTGQGNQEKNSTKFPQTYRSSISVRPPGEEESSDEPTLHLLKN